MNSDTHGVTQIKLFELVNRSYGELWLPNTDLRGLDLSGAHLYRACLRGSDLSKAKGAEGKADMAADLSGADLRYANLCGTILSEADLSGAYLNYANLRQADLTGAYLRGANLGEATLRGAKLNGETILREASLKEADLRGVDLTAIELDLADLREAKINESDNPTEFSPKWGLVWKLVNRAEVREALDEAGRAAELAALQAELDELNADGLNNASLYGADLRGLNLSHLNLYQVDLRATKIDKDTKFCKAGGLIWELVNREARREKLNPAERDQELKDLQDKLNKLGADDLNNISLRGADLRGLDLSPLTLSLVDLRETKIDKKSRFCVSDRNPVRLIWKIVNEGAYGVKLSEMPRSGGVNGEVEVDLSKANLRGSDFRGVDASKVKGNSWEAAIVEGLKFDDETDFGIQGENIKGTLRRRKAREVFKRKTASRVPSGV